MVFFFFGIISNFNTVYNSWNKNTHTHNKNLHHFFLTFSTIWLFCCQISKIHWLVACKCQDNNTRMTASIFIYTEAQSCCVNNIRIQKERLCSANSADIPHTYSIWMHRCVDIIKCHACMVLNMQALFILSVTRCIIHYLKPLK